MPQKFIRNFKKVVNLLIVLLVVASLTSGCWNRNTTQEVKKMAAVTPGNDSGKQIESLEFTLFLHEEKPFVPPTRDVVAEGIAKYWNINVKERYYEAGQFWHEKMNLFIASDSLPDVFEFPAYSVDSIARYSDKFVDMAAYLNNPQIMPNMNRFINPNVINNMKTMDGKLMYLPTAINPDFSDPVMAEKFKNEALDLKMSPYVIHVREDVLALLGYKFTPVAEIERKFRERGGTQRLTYEDFRIEPEIKTIDQFTKFLMEVKRLRLKTPDGSEVTPYGGTDPTFQFGGAFAFNWFRWIDGKAVAYYGSPYAKDMFKTLNHWYRQGLLSKDGYVYLRQPDKIAEQVAAGKYAAFNGEWVPNIQEAEKKLQERIPGASIRFIPVPRYKDTIPPYIENYVPGANKGILINKDFKDVDKLIRYIDWLWSDEAQELIEWGPESGGLWEVKNGRKVFKNPELYEAIQKNVKTVNNEDAKYYGLVYNSASVKGLIMNEAVNIFKYTNSYGNRYSFLQEMKRVNGESMKCMDNTMSSIPKGEAASKVNDFFWSDSWNLHSKMVLARSDEDFEKQYEAVFKSFMEKTEYGRAMEAMTRFFTSMGNR